ncbi:hypothetical protein ACEPPN_013444 [Leptodophora sp. 'Broadleaf-Isolate-01']
MFRAATSLKTTPSPTSASGNKLRLPTSHIDEDFLTCPCTEPPSHQHHYLRLKDHGKLMLDFASSSFHHPLKGSEENPSDSEDDGDNYGYNDSDEEKNDASSDSESYAPVTHSSYHQNQNQNQKVTGAYEEELSYCSSGVKPVIYITDEDTMEGIININNTNRGRNPRGEEGKESEYKHLITDIASANGYKTYHLLPEIQVQVESRSSSPACEIEEFDAWESLQGGAQSVQVESDDEDEDVRREGREAEDVFEYRSYSPAFAGVDVAGLLHPGDLGFGGCVWTEKASGSSDAGDVDCLEDMTCAASPQKVGRNKKGVSPSQSMASRPCASDGDWDSEEDGDEVDSFEVEDGEVGQDLDFVIVGEDEGEEMDVDGDCDDVGGIAAQKCGHKYQGGMEGLAWQSICAERGDLWCVSMC